MPATGRSSTPEDRELRRPRAPAVAPDGADYEAAADHHQDARSATAMAVAVGRRSVAEHEAGRAAPKKGEAPILNVAFATVV